MSNLSREEIKEYLQQKLSALHIEAQENRTSFNMGQAVGSIGFFSGVIGCFGLPILGLPVLVLGASLYGASTIIETITTGECTPIPFMATRFTSMALRAAQVHLEMDDDDLDVIHYLPKRDRILYLLIMSQDVMMTDLLFETPQTKWNSVINSMITKATKVMGSVGVTLDHSNVGDFAKDIINKELTVEIKPTQNISSIPEIKTIQEYKEVEPELIFSEVEIIPKATLETEYKPAIVSTPKSNIRYFDFDLATDSGYVESALFIGASRTGKSWAADWYARTLKRRYGSLKAFYCTPVDRTNAQESESHLFDFCESQNMLRLNLLSENNVAVLDHAAEQMLEMLNRFIYLCQNDLTSKSNPAIFIQDELTLILEKSKISSMMKLYYDTYISHLICMSSGGKAIGVGVWGIAPTGSVGGLGLNQYVLSTMQSFFIGTTTDFKMPVFKGALRNDMVCRDAPSQSFLWDCKNKGIRTIISYGAGNWEPLFDMNTEKLPYGQRKSKKPESDPLVDELVTYIKSKGMNASNISVDKVMGTPRAKSTGITEDQVKRALELAR